MNRFNNALGMVLMALCFAFAGYAAGIGQFVGGNGVLVHDAGTQP